VKRALGGGELYVSEEEPPAAGRRVWQGAVGETGAGEEKAGENALHVEGQMRAVSKANATGVDEAVLSVQEVLQLLIQAVVAAHVAAPSHLSGRLLHSPAADSGPSTAARTCLSSRLSSTLLPAAEFFQRQRHNAPQNLRHFSRSSTIHSPSFHFLPQVVNNKSFMIAFEDE